MWPEIPKSPEEWSYTGPLLGIVVAALVAGEAIVWRMFHPRKRGGRPVSADADGPDRLSASHT